MGLQNLYSPVQIRVAPPTDTRPLRFGIFLFLFKILFTPVKIGNMEVPNRFVVPPEGTNLANADGFSHFRDSIS